MKRILAIWKWEFGKEKQQMITAQAVAMILSLILLIFYKLGKSQLFHLMALLKGMPAEFLALFGIRYQTESGNFAFFDVVLWIWMSVYLIYAAMMRTARAVYQDEASGFAFLMVNQWYTRTELVAGRFTWSLVSFFGGYAVWYLENLVLILLGGISREQRINGLLLLTGVCIRIVFIAFFLISLLYLAMVLPRNGKRILYGSFSQNVLYMTWLLASLYKLRDIVFWLMSQFGRDPGIWKTLLGWLNLFYWISPLSWINPFSGHGSAATVVQIVFCFIVGAGLFFLTGERYERRKIA